MIAAIWERKKARKFYKEYMERRRPKTPRCICKNIFFSWLGIASPSLYWIVVTGAKGEKTAKALEEFEQQQQRYICYKRTMTKEQWKALYRQVRKERKKHEKF